MRVDRFPTRLNVSKISIKRIQYLSLPPRGFHFSINEGSSPHPRTSVPHQSSLNQTHGRKLFILFHLQHKAPQGRRSSRRLWLSPWAETYCLKKSPSQWWRREELDRWPGRGRQGLCLHCQFPQDSLLRARDQSYTGCSRSWSHFCPCFNLILLFCMSLMCGFMSLINAEFIYIYIYILYDWWWFRVWTWFKF